MVIAEELNINLRVVIPFQDKLVSQIPCALVYALSINIKEYLLEFLI